MALLEILTYPNPVLRKKAKHVTAFTDELKALVSDMAETMYDAPGIGLAAPQVGRSIRLVVMDLTSQEEEDKLMVLVNPEISEEEGSELAEEGCLSLIDLTAKVKRFTHIKVKAQTIEGDPFEFEADDWFARVIQHEVDHLDGTLFLDRISVLKRAMYKKKRKKQLAEEQS